MSRTRFNVCRASLALGVLAGTTLTVAVAQAAEYYVSPTGSDANGGTMLEPFATLQKAADLAEPGDTVWLRGGTYRVVEPATTGAGIRITKSGTADDSRIRFWADPGELRSSTSRHRIEQLGLCLGGAAPPKASSMQCWPLSARRGRRSPDTRVGHGFGGESSEKRAELFS